ncbi:MAG TPA: Gfo/Idh/MocA family oxidoreductase [Mucilaginibacter sp.]|jgi:scyllo-inositol 2-dehydrogenase (NADP+)|nr:Gfo/Idh/MocA family oxidoreductase [Mucilaginibacter sp.]
MNKILNTAIIGFGFSGETFFAPFVEANPNFNLKKIYTTDPARVAKAKSLYPNGEIVDSTDNIMNDAAIDLVLVGTPNTSHLSLSKQALLAGKHVLVEKPFTVTTAEADELIALAKQQNRILTVHHNRRFDSGHNTVKKVIASGKLGRLVEYEVHYDRFRRELRPDAWREKPLPGSGILYDLGAHLIDGALELFGTPLEVTCIMLTQRPGLEVEDNFEIILTYPAGLKVTLKGGMLVKVPGPGTVLYGDHGTFIKYGMDVQEAALKNGLTPNNTANWGIEPESIWGKLTYEKDGKDITEVVESVTGNYQNLFQNVYEAITEGKELVVKPEQARQTIRVIELCFQSNAEKRTVRYTN